MFTRILVPLDGSPRAERAVPVAARLARASGGAVVLVEVTSPPIEYGPYLGPGAGVPVAFDRGYDEAASYLSALSKGGDLDGVACETRVLAGPVADAILAEAVSRRADVIVMTSHGRTGFARWVLGSVAQRITRRAPVPVLLLRDAGAVPVASAFEGTGPVRALVALDGSPLAEAALEPAIALARALSGAEGAALHLLRVPEIPAANVREGPGGSMRAEALDADAMEASRTEALGYLADVAEQLRKGPLAGPAGSPVVVTWSATLGADPARVIVETAEDRVGVSVDEPQGARAFDLIAMATHGRGGFARVALGSVTERVVDGTRLPMLITRPAHSTGK